MQFQKPPIGSVIDWCHPLSKGLISCFLFNENSIRPKELVTGIVGSGISSGYLKVTSDGLRGWSATDYVSFPTITMPTFPVTVVALLNNHGSYGRFIHYGSIAPTSGGWSVGFNSSGTPKGLRVQLSDGSVTGTTSSNDHLSATILSLPSYQCAVTITGSNPLAPSFVGFYVNGRFVQSSATVANSYIPATAVTGMVMGIRNTSPIDWGAGNTEYRQILVYNRALSAIEIQSLYEDPYQMIQGSKQPNSPVYLPKLTTYGSVRR